MGYNKREDCIRFLNSPNETKDWNTVKIMIFDAPQSPDLSYSQRLELLKQSKPNQDLNNCLDIPSQHPVLTLVTTTICQDRKHAESFFDRLCKERSVDTRAEGIVLRDPSAWYYQANAFFSKKVTNIIINLYISIRQTR
jgi:hypothetical protein